MLSSFLVAIGRYTHNGVVFREDWAPVTLAYSHGDVDEGVHKFGGRARFYVRRVFVFYKES